MVAMVWSCLRQRRQWLFVVASAAMAISDFSWWIVMEATRDCSWWCWFDVVWLWSFGVVGKVVREREGGEKNQNFP